VGPFATNCYVIWDASTKQAAIIDPGGDRQRIEEMIASHGLDVKYTLLTHGHPDHTFFAGELAGHYGAEVAMHESDIPTLTESLPIAEMFYDLTSYEAFSPSIVLNDGDWIDLGDSRIRVLHTPGHSRGGVSFVTHEGIFCGDTVFAGSVGRTDFPGGSMEQLINSIQAQLLTLDDQTPLYPGHGPATTVGAERRSNPYLQ
jgi:glyoxylase-like metal-dependent hydrolase (beta-lactamase superfamily II)